MVVLIMYKLTFDNASALLQTGGAIHENAIFTVFDRNGKKFGYIEWSTFLQLRRELPLVKKPRNHECVYNVYKLKGW